MSRVLEERDTASPPWWRLLSAGVATAAVALAAVVVPTTAAEAAEGPAPEPKENRVLAGVHADAVSTFLDDGQIALASKADVAEGSGTRFAAEDVWFHLDDTAQRTVPAGYEFIAPVGSTIWLAPESNPGTGKLWPGFNTESVSLGAIENNRSTFTLTSVEGPGDLEVYTGGGFSAPNRLWSSRDASLRTFDIGRTHMHANWAFTAAGTYRLEVEGAVTVNGVVQTASATYTFVVGELPEPVVTTTRLSASATTLVGGDPLTLTAAVTPAEADGFVEFRNGTTVLGHEPVEEGTATFTTTAPAVGTHALTAVYVPAVANLAATSTSEAVSVTVGDGSGVEFGVTGVQDSYAPGDTLSVALAGYQLAEGEQVRWRIRPVGSDSANGSTLTTAPSLIYSTVLHIADDGYEVSAQVRQGSTVVATTGWVPLRVTSDAPTLPAPTIGATTPSPIYNGDRMVLDYPPVQLADGESAQLVFRTSSSRWAPVAGNTRFGNVTEGAEQASFHVRSVGTFSFAIRVVKDGIGVRQSSAVTASAGFYEAHVENVQSLYRAGQTLNAIGRYFPVRDGVDDVSYEWRWYAPGGSSTVISAGLGTPPPVVRELTAADNGSTLYLTITRPNFGGSSSSSAKINVTDTAGQIFQFAPASEHYHQNDNVDLRAAVDPALSEEDTVEWEWKWPGGAWEPFPGMPRLGQQIKAEQAMNGVEVRATLHFPNDAHEPMVAGPLTIHIDDHGAAANQKPTIGGATIVPSGEAVTLARELPDNGQTLLTAHRWERKAAGAEDWSTVAGQAGTELSFLAGAADDGAQYRVSILKPDGTISYGPSPAVALSVTAPTKRVPVAPAKPGVTVDGSTVVASWVMPADGGSPITGYTVRLAGAAEPIVRTAAGDATSVAFTNLAAGVYTATVVATNEVGDSDASAPSEQVTVSAPGPEEPNPGESTNPVPDSDLTGDTRNGVHAPEAATPGSQITIAAPGHAGERVRVWLHSSPSLLGTVTLDASAAAVVTIPADAPLGEHRVVVQALDGSLIGWTPITLAKAADVGPDGELLASTGGEITPLLGTAVVLLLVGAVVLVAARRRRAPAAD